MLWCTPTTTCRPDMPTYRAGVLRSAGTVAILAAGHQVVTGLNGVRGHRLPATRSPNVDSEIRFYAGWYAIAGLLMHRAAGNPALDRTLRPLIEAGWGLAFASRCVSLRAFGRPDGLFVALAALEVAVAGALAANPPARPAQQVPLVSGWVQGDA